MSYLSTPQVYRDAADHVANGWCQKRARNEEGGECPLEAVVQALSFGIYGLEKRTVPPVMAQQIHRQLLASSWEYRLLRRSRLRKFRNTGYQVDIMLWNDAPWRRKQTVVSMLLALAERLDAEERQAQQAADHEQLNRLSKELEDQWAAAGPRATDERELVSC